MTSELPIEQGLLTVPPKSGIHRGTVIFLHGMGQTAKAWVPIIETLAIHIPDVKWVIPQAPSSPVTMNQGRTRPTWFDVFHLPPCVSCGMPDVAHSLARIEHIILSEIRPDGGRVVVAGFSQGAALSMVLALTSLHDIAGVASLSGWIPRKYWAQMKDFEPSLPVFWGHGTLDREIPHEMAEEAIAFMKQGLNFPEEMITFKTYLSLEHAINDREIDDFANWLRGILV